MQNSNNSTNNCTHDCSSCGKADSCDKKMPEKLKANKNSNIKKIIGVVSGKGGVGKSLVCAMLANKLSKNNLKVGILDADVTGPSIPKIFGVKGQLTASEDALNVAIGPNNLKMISANLMLDDPDSPVAWRGPVVSGAISQFFNMTNWGDIDVMLVDMPPGTSDVFLTVMQMLPIDGIICVTSPQDLVEMIVGKAINLARMMNVNVLSLVENMSYFTCNNCGQQHDIFGKSQIEDTARKYNIENFDRLPIDKGFAKMCDQGKAMDIDTSKLLDNSSKAIINL